MVDNERGEYPIVSIIAHDLLTTLVCTIASKFAFNVGGRILFDYKSKKT